MHVHVALGPAEFPAAPLDGRAALVIDVLRATTSVVAACAAGCRSVIPVPDFTSLPVASMSCAWIVLYGGRIENTE
jgi:phosphosulfolactate phosphohydrolase-like enzyme